MGGWQEEGCEVSETYATLGVVEALVGARSEVLEVLADGGLLVDGAGELCEQSASDPGGKNGCNERTYDIAEASAREVDGGLRNVDSTTD